MADWVSVAEAIACRIQYEYNCGRQKLIREDFVKLVSAEVLQAQIEGKVEAEFNHPDLPGNTRIDLIARSPQAQNIQALVEIKWVRRSTDQMVRQWAREIVADVLRVERVQAGLAQGCDRIVLVAGEAQEMRTQLWERRVQAGNGNARENVVANLLQARLAAADAQAPRTISLQNLGPAFQKFIRGAASELLNALPTVYNIRLVAHFATRHDGIECAIWKVTRPQQQRVVRSANILWPPMN